MQLVPLWKESWDLHWKIFSIADEAGLCPIVQAFSALREAGNHERHIAAMLALIQTIAVNEEGPRIYHGNNAVCHEAVKGESIYSFRKGSLRLYWFYGKDRRVVVCPHVSAKHQPKTPKSLARALVDMRDAYLAAHQNSAIIIVDE